MSTAPSQLLLEDALARESEAYRLLLDGEAERAARPLRETAELYRSSWEQAGPRSYGRLIGMLKATVLLGDGEAEAGYALEQIGDQPDSPASCYAVAVAALVRGDDPLARRAAAGMRAGGDAFARTAEAIDAIAAGEGDRYADALGAILADFEARDEHLTGVEIADTAMVLERLAERRGIAASASSPMLPPAGRSA
jgi:hypothetical protein